MRETCWTSARQQLSRSTSLADLVSHHNRELYSDPGEELDIPEPGETVANMFGQGCYFASDPLKSARVRFTGHGCMMIMCVLFCHCVLLEYNVREVFVIRADLGGTRHQVQGGSGQVAAARHSHA